MRTEYITSNTSSSRWCLRILPLCLLLLGGCSAIAPIGQEPVATTQAAEKSAGEVTEVTPEAARPVNPYLQNRKAVPAAVEKRFASAIAAMDEEKWSQAEAILLELTVDYPQLSGAHLNLGICYRQLSKHDLAEDYFKQSIKANANNLEAYNWLALVKREQGEFKAAEQLYRQALAIWPDHAASHYNLGILCELYFGDLQRAHQHYMSYQKLQTEPNRRVAGWLKDLQRRIQALAENEVTP